MVSVTGMVGNLVQEQAVGPGTGAVTLTGAPSTGFVSFSSQFANGQKIFYAISDGTNSEIGIGVFNIGTSQTLTRTTVLWNSLGTTSFVNFTSTVRVWNGLPAERLALLDDNFRLPQANMPRPQQDYVKKLTQETMPTQGTGYSPATALNFDTLVRNDLGLGSNPWNYMTIKTAGFYHVQAGMQMTTTQTAGNNMCMTLIKGLNVPATSTPLASMMSSYASGNTSPTGPITTWGTLRWSGFLAAGDVLSFCQSTLAFTSPQVKMGGGHDSFFSITKMTPA